MRPTVFLCQSFLLVTIGKARSTNTIEAPVARTQQTELEDYERKVYSGPGHYNVSWTVDIKLQNKTFRLPFTRETAFSGFLSVFVVFSKRTPEKLREKLWKGKTVVHIF